MFKKLLSLTLALLFLLVGCTAPQKTSGVSEESPLPDGSSLEVHFIDVGQADAALVICDGKAMMIDGGNADDSSLVYSYLKRLGVDTLEYVIATHAHEDHIGGLSGVLNYATARNAYCSVADYESRVFDNFVKYLEKQGVELKVPDVGDTFGLGSATVEILGVLSDTADHNDTSIILRIDYGDTSFLFMGDAEREAENAVLDRGGNVKATVIKVGHHGSADSSSYRLLRESAPEYAVISVGENNSYGHPTEEALSRLEDAEVEVFRTDLLGTVICKSDGKTVTFETDKTSTESEEESKSADETECEYIGNTNSMIFHYSTCAGVKKMSEKNKYYHSGTRAQIIALGYTPCKSCNP